MQMSDAAMKPKQKLLSLEKVIGTTSLHNSSVAVNPATGEAAYVAGCVIVVYNPQKNRQTRFFRTEKSVSCLTFSRDGNYLAAGERGHKPSVVVWEMSSGQALAGIV